MMGTSGGLQVTTSSTCVHEMNTRFDRYLRLHSDAYKFDARGFAVFVRTYLISVRVHLVVHGQWAHVVAVAGAAFDT